MQVYDLAWSPTGEYIIAGSTDNTARVFHTADGTFLSFRLKFYLNIEQQENVYTKLLNIRITSKA